MIKVVAFHIAEEISSHWSETLAWPALLLALHIAVFVQVVLAVAFLIVWTCCRGKAIHKKLTADAAAAQHQ